MNRPTTTASHNSHIGDSGLPSGPATPDLAWRILAFLPPLALVFFVPLPDRPLPAWSILLLALGSSRIVALRERLSGIADFLASLPFMAAAAVACARLSPDSLAQKIFATLAAAFLLAALGSLVRSGRGSERWPLAAATLPTLIGLAFGWAFLPLLLVSGPCVVIGLLALTALRSRRPR